MRALHSTDTETVENYSLFGIVDNLFTDTIQPVIDDLKNYLKKDTPQDGWDAWAEKWSKFSLRSFLLNGDVLNNKKLRPWPEGAIQAYKVNRIYACNSDCKI